MPAGPGSHVSGGDRFHLIPSLVPPPFRRTQLEARALGPGDGVGKAGAFGARPATCPHRDLGKGEEFEALVREAEKQS